MLLLKGMGSIVKRSTFNYLGKNFQRKIKLNCIFRVKGDYAGMHSIRINDQYRIVFRFSESEAHDVKIVDYHK